MSEAINTPNDTNNTNQTQVVDTQNRPSNLNNYLSFDMFDSVEYDGTHLYYCQFEDAPAPFDKWFPAQDVQEPTKCADTSTMHFGIEEINTLNSYNSIDFRVEFLDDDKATLENWIRAWSKSISSSQGAIDYQGFNYLDDILKRFYLTKYNWQKQKVYTRCYFVIPAGSMNIPHSDDPAIKTLAQKFASFGMEEL